MIFFFLEDGELVTLTIIYCTHTFFFIDILIAIFHANSFSFLLWFGVSSKSPGRPPKIQWRTFLMETVSYVSHSRKKYAKTRLLIEKTAVFVGPC